ncbi:CBF-domain-containing protein [Neoconidiobolus thromboides FSU 785]|nr:CBF-domain-containing protein [Neoconidiobolus thromboides FSU 785]
MVKDKASLNSLKSQKKGKPSTGLSKKNIDPNLKEKLNDIKTSILSSKKDLNLILTLLEHTNSSNNEEVYLSIKCMQGVIITLIKQGDIKIYRDNKPKSEIEDKVGLKVEEWLTSIYKKWIKRLLNLLIKKDPAIQVAAFEALINLLKEDALQGYKFRQVYSMNISLIEQITDTLCNNTSSEELLNYISEKYMNTYHDLLYYISKFMALSIRKLDPKEVKEEKINWLFKLLTQLRNMPKNEEDIHEFYCLNPNEIKEDKEKEKEKKHFLMLINSYKKEYQELFLAFFTLPLSTTVIKKLLLIIHHRLLPNFLHPLKMLDFLTESYDFGGSISLLALNGLFTLIHKYNMDYPQFYQKLYNLFNMDILHSKYRSRFFRLSELFLNSGYLPVNLVAAFVKKMSRLALFAPPGAIVIVIPFIYNLMKAHPTCMKLIHNDNINDFESDPYDFTCNEPSLSKAIDSSLWEIESLTCHYYSNVSSLAKLFSELFNKPNYQLEHFLDHNYNSMLQVEFQKIFKKVPALLNNPKLSLFTEEKGICLNLNKEWEF